MLTGKAKRTVPDARGAIISWSDSFPVADSTWSSFQMVFEISATHHLEIWDALILAFATESRWRVLLSEDFQDGFSCNRISRTEDHPYGGVWRMILKSMELPSAYIQQVANRKTGARCSADEFSPAGHNDINLIAIMRALRVRVRRAIPAHFETGGVQDRYAQSVRGPRPGVSLATCHAQSATSANSAWRVIGTRDRTRSICARVTVAEANPSPSEARLITSPHGSQMRLLPYVARVCPFDM